MRNKGKTYFCEICGIEKPFRYGIGHANRFCSKDCYSVHLTNIRESKVLYCPICGKKNSLDKKLRWRETCSKECEMALKKSKSIGHKCPHPFPSGKDNPAYIHGKTDEIMALRTSQKYTNWRNEIFKRDKWTCQMCGQRGGKLVADHIQAFSTYPELRFELSNGRTLCHECHLKTDNYGHKYSVYSRETNAWFQNLFIYYLNSPSWWINRT